MKRKLIGLFLICLVILLATLAIFKVREEEKGTLEKITVADTTLTSWTYMSSSKLFISKLERMKYAI